MTAKPSDCMLIRPAPATDGRYGDAAERTFTAEPLVYSPVGEYIRSWWEGTAAKLGMRTGEMCADERFQTVLNRYGTD